MISPKEARKKLESIHQDHLIDAGSLPLDQIEQLDVGAFQKQVACLNSEFSAPSVQAPINIFSSKDVHDTEAGKELIQAGKVGCLLVAGGQGTRLGLDGPKGTFPIAGKSLFQRFCERVLVAGPKLQVAVMTSPLNHAETVAFFEAHSFWGLEAKQVSFFSQSMLPILDLEGRLLLDSDGRLLEGPDGNGAALASFYHSGIWQEWEASGIEWVQWVLVDNPLAQPFDPVLASFQATRDLDIVVKCCERRDPSESVGVLVSSGGHLAVVEYTEISEQQQMARKEDGQLLFPAANISLFGFSMEFIKSAAQRSMPLHLARKKVKSLGVEAWKFEKFIFDVLAFGSKVAALQYPRSECFAPLKNATGLDSPETVEAALIDFERALSCKTADRLVRY